MIKQRDLVRHLTRHGCRRVRQGGRHEVWTDARGERISTLPRHREIPRGTARAICAQLGVPPI
jgi:mRNA interferase HicA